METNGPCVLTSRDTGIGYDRTHKITRLMDHTLQINFKRIPTLPVDVRVFFNYKRRKLKTL